MHYLLLSIFTALFVSTAQPVSGMTCKQVKEVAETVLNADHLSSDDKYFILEGLFGGYYAECSQYTEDAND